MVLGEMALGKKALGETALGETALGEIAVRHNCRPPSELRSFRIAQICANFINPKHCYVIYIELFLKISVT